MGEPSESTENTVGPPGYYWIRPRADDPEWVIAEWDDSVFWFPVEENALGKDDVAEIDARRIVRE
jgi:hypothetical protein